MQNDEKTTADGRGTLASGFTPDAEFHLNARSKEYENVRDFHRKFGLLCFDTPGHLSSDKLKERIEFLQAELDEFIEAAGFNPTYEARGGRDGRLGRASGRDRVGPYVQIEVGAGSLK